MKIEITCSHCEAVLRVGSEHAGKQLRCPTCQNLLPIPSEPSISAEVPVEPVQPSRFSGAMDDFPQPTPHYIHPQVAESTSQLNISLVFGIAGIILNFGCSCLIPVFVVLNCIGIFWAIQSPSHPLRTAALITNGIALAIAAFQFLGVFAFLAMGF